LTERSVPCGACTLCCRGGEAIVLHPESGDRIADYETREVWHPLYRDRAVHILQQRPDGSCVYVGPFGCTIWDKRPTICREFDCREFVKRFSRSQIEKILAAGTGSDAVVKRGRELLKAGK
jgi:Fe-S-cluster containining protein